MSLLIRLRVAFYTSVIVMHTTNIMYILWLMKHTESKDYYVQYFTELKFRFLTTWTVVLQILHSFLGLMCDVSQLKNSSEKNYQLPQTVNKYREIVFAALVWPCSFVVFTVFWTIFTYDRSLVFPESLDTIIPPLPNHVIHTIIVPVALFEMMFRPRNEPETHSRNVAQLSLHLATYLAVFIFTYKEHGIWLYPIFTKLSGTIYFPLLIAFVVVISFFFYYAQWPLTKMIHGSKKKQLRTNGEVYTEKKNK